MLEALRLLWRLITLTLRLSKLSLKVGLQVLNRLEDAVKEYERWSKRR